MICNKLIITMFKLNSKIWMFLILSLLTLLSCSKNDNDVKGDPLWIVELDQPKSTASQILTEKGYYVIDQDSALDVKSKIEYLDVIWDGASIDLDNGAVSSIMLSKAGGTPFSKEQKKTIVHYLDDKIGKHEFDDSHKDDLGYTLWSWTENPTKAYFMSMLNDQFGFVAIFKDESQIDMEF